MDERARIEFEEHISICSSCREEMQDIIKVVNMLRSLPEAELPEDFSEKLHQKLVRVKEEELHGRKWLPAKLFTVKNSYLKALSTVAAGALVIFALKGIFFNGFLNRNKIAKLENSTKMSKSVPEELMAKDSILNESAEGESIETRSSSNDFTVNDSTANDSVAIGSAANELVENKSTAMIKGDFKGAGSSEKPIDQQDIGIMFTEGTARSKDSSELLKYSDKEAKEKNSIEGSETGVLDDKNATDKSNIKSFTADDFQSANGKSEADKGSETDMVPETNTGSESDIKLSSVRGIEDSNVTIMMSTESACMKNLQEHELLFGNNKIKVSVLIEGNTAEQEKVRSVIMESGLLSDEEKGNMIFKEYNEKSEESAREGESTFALVELNMRGINLNPLIDAIIYSKNELNAQVDCEEPIWDDGIKLKYDELNTKLLEINKQISATQEKSDSSSQSDTEKLIADRNEILNNIEELLQNTEYIAEIRINLTRK